MISFFHCVIFLNVSCITEGSYIQLDTIGEYYQLTNHREFIIFSEDEDGIHVSSGDLILGYNQCKTNDCLSFKGFVFIAKPNHPDVLTLSSETNACPKYKDGKKYLLQTTIPEYTTKTSSVIRYIYSECDGVSLITFGNLLDDEFVDFKPNAVWISANTSSQLLQ